jgi:hypothetical protein
VKPQRREPSRRITPELLDFYIKSAHALREEALRDTVQGLWDLLVRLKRLYLTPLS